MHGHSNFIPIIDCETSNNVFLFDLSIELLLLDENALSGIIPIELRNLHNAGKNSKRVFITNVFIGNHF